MPRWTKHEEAGVLMHNQFGHVLVGPGGGFWILEGLPWRARKYMGRHVVVEGLWVDFNSLSVERVRLSSSEQ